MVLYCVIIVFVLYSIINGSIERVEISVNIEHSICNIVGHSDIGQPV